MLGALPSQFMEASLPQPVRIIKIEIMLEILQVWHVLDGAEDKGSDFAGCNRWVLF